MGTKVCDTLNLYDTGDDQDEVHLRKRRTYCNTAMEKLWSACKDKATSQGYLPSQNLTDCLKENATMEELLDIKEAFTLYFT